MKWHNVKCFSFQHVLSKASSLLRYSPVSLYVYRNFGAQHVLDIFDHSAEPKGTLLVRLRLRKLNGDFGGMI
jgi:hypothetical protein